MINCKHSIDQLYTIDIDGVDNKKEVWCDCGIAFGRINIYESIGRWYYDTSNNDSPREREWLE